jgi:Ca-activated chloride channel family protein
LPALRYGASKAVATGNTNEVAHLRLRYKLPSEQASKLIETPILSSSLSTKPSESIRFASAVAAYADLLRGGTNIGNWSWNEVGSAARGAQGDDRYGLRREFVELVTQARQIVAAENRTPAIAGE